nr:prepilin-type N-terminal cleavage/methylation domain-containing protein [Psychrobacter proteolyticus]
MNASINNLPTSLRAAGSGFTLIELMVTIAVLAIIVSIAAPNISTQLANQRVKATAATLTNALKEAKVESVIRRQSIEFSIDDSNHTLVVESGNSGEIASYSYSTKNIITTDKATVVFRPSKRADAATYTICDSEKPSTSMQVIVTAIAGISTVAGGTCG